jgi:hypothetical protein
MASELEAAKRLAAQALGHNLTDRDRRAIIAATSIRAVRRATAKAAARTRWCKSRPSRGALTDMARLLGARRGVSCEELLHTAAEGAQSGEDPKKFLEASRVVGRVLERANPAKDPAFAKLSKHLRRDLDDAYKSLGRSLKRLLRERHRDHKDLAEEAEAFVRCVAKARPGHFEESCCNLLPSFSHCRAKLGAIDRLSLEVERELPVLGATLGRKVALFGAAMLGAALLVGGAAYSGWLGPTAGAWAASGVGAAQGHAQWAWDKLSALPRWVMGGTVAAADPLWPAVIPKAAADPLWPAVIPKPPAVVRERPMIYMDALGVGHRIHAAGPAPRTLFGKGIPDFITSPEGVTTSPTTGEHLYSRIVGQITGATAAAGIAAQSLKDALGGLAEWGTSLYPAAAQKSVVEQVLQSPVVVPLHRATNLGRL